MVWKMRQRSLSKEKRKKNWIGIFTIGERINALRRDQVLAMPGPVFVLAIGHSSDPVLFHWIIVLDER